jgi:hypothetical protein
MKTKTLAIGTGVAVALLGAGYWYYTTHGQGSKWKVSDEFTIQPPGFDAIKVQVLAVQYNSSIKDYEYELGDVETGGELPGWWTQSNLESWIVAGTTAVSTTGFMTEDWYNPASWGFWPWNWATSGTAKKLYAAAGGTALGLIIGIVVSETALKKAGGVSKAGLIVGTALGGGVTGYAIQSRWGIIK